MTILETIELTHDFLRGNSDLTRDEVLSLLSKTRADVVVTKRAGDDLCDATEAHRGDCAQAWYVVSRCLIGNDRIDATGAVRGGSRRASP